MFGKGLSTGVKSLQVNGLAGWGVCLRQPAILVLKKKMLGKLMIPFVIQGLSTIGQFDEGW